MKILRQAVCVICNTSFVVKPHTTGKYCSLSCGNKGRTKITREDNELLYIKNPIKCKLCENILTYFQKITGNKFCSSSCGATYSNLRRDKDTYVRQAISLRKSISNNENRFPKIDIGNGLYRTTGFKEGEHCIIGFCVTCGKTIRNYMYKTCGKECKSKLLSISVRGKTGGSTKQYIQVKESSGRLVSLDSSWELIMANNLDNNDITWSRPSSFLLSNGRKYTPDFYLPDYNLYLDPKAYRKGYLIQIDKIKQFEQEYEVRCLVISDVKLLNWEYIKSTIN